MINLTVFFDCSNYILAEVSHGANKWYLAYVYGPPRRSEWIRVWMELAQHINSIDGPWCYVGDFNAILKLKDN